MSGPWIVAFVLLSLVVVAVAVLTLGLLRRSAAVLEALEQRGAGGMPAPSGLAPGTRVPDFAGVDRSGAVVTRDELAYGARVFLFLTPTCAPCRSLAEELARRAPVHLGVPLVVVVQSAPDRDPGLPATIDALVFDPDGTVGRAFDVTGYPYAMAVDGDGVVTKGAVPGSVSDLRSLADAAARGGDADRAAARP
ncbi:MAG TPA: hypothetical protein VHJ34_09175 [Actinomycetota bacterium]|nr:hypothetical protein [Actinomycetota bacterium]